MLRTSDDSQQVSRQMLSGETASCCLSNQRAAARTSCSSSCFAIDSFMEGSKPAVERPYGAPNHPLLKHVSRPDEMCENNIDYIVSC